MESNIFPTLRCFIIKLCIFIWIQIFLIIAYKKVEPKQEFVS